MSNRKLAELKRELAVSYLALGKSVRETAGAVGISTKTAHELQRRLPEVFERPPRYYSAVDMCYLPRRIIASQVIASFDTDHPFTAPTYKENNKEVIEEINYICQQVKALLVNNIQDTPQVKGDAESLAISAKRLISFARNLPIQTAPKYKALAIKLIQEHL